MQELVTDPQGQIPTFILPNPLSGNGLPNERGELSYALKGCLKACRNTVIEFDALPLEEQYAFWCGLIIGGILDVRALVYSGGKSIHGLIRLDETKDFAAQWQSLRRAFCSDADPRYRCDEAYANPIQMMRFPGAIRPETGRLQKLIYLG